MNNGFTTTIIDGNTIGIKFGIPAVRQVAEKMSKMTLVDDDGNYNELGIAHIMYAGYCCHCLIKEQEPVIPFERFYETAEDGVLDPAVMQRNADVVKVFEESKFVKFAIERMNASVVKKKKETGMKSKPSATEN